MLVANRYEGWVSDHLKIPTVLRMLVLTGSYIWKIPEPCKTPSLVFLLVLRCELEYIFNISHVSRLGKHFSCAYVS